QALQAAFRDPTSPYHIQPGTQGPASPDEPPPHSHLPLEFTSASEPLSPAPGALALARTKLIERGYDPTSFWEQPIVWGHHDAFQHVNNVHYVRFFESGRMQWLVSVAHEIGGARAVEDMLRARGVGVILKSISVRYRRPVTYPDTLLIAHAPHIPAAHHSTSLAHPTPLAHTQFGLRAVAWSYAQGCVVAESDSELVWYDHDKLSKCDPGEGRRAVVQRRIREKTD
ncbi:Thioesterase/thiol ester dehydrase-isomerase, partial [Athelia psychrophila]